MERRPREARYLSEYSCNSQSPRERFCIKAQPALMSLKIKDQSPASLWRILNWILQTRPRSLEEIPTSSVDKSKKCC